ncbi:MAG TPA: hypothetical protein VGD22_15830 [Sphingobacteriaceae bacterium]
MSKLNVTIPDGTLKIKDDGFRLKPDTHIELILSRQASLDR